MDKERLDYMKAAEKRIGNTKKAGIYEWSPTLEKAGKRVTYWKLRLFQLRGGKVNEKRFEKLREQQSLEDLGLNSKEYIVGQLTNAWKNLRRVQQKSESLREDHLEEMAEHYALKRDTSKEVELKKLHYIKQV